MVKALVKLGSPHDTQKVHVFLKHPDGRTTVVPVHPGEERDRRLLKKISADISLNWEEFMFLVDEG